MAETSAVVKFLSSGRYGMKEARRMPYTAISRIIHLVTETSETNRMNRLENFQLKRLKNRPKMALRNGDPVGAFL